MRKLQWPFVMLVSLLVFTGVVFAADTPAVDPSTNPQGALQQFWDAITARKWGVAAVVGTMLLVAFVRFIAPRMHGKFGDFILQTRVSAALAFVSGMLMAVATKLLSGSPWSVAIIVYGFGFGVMAIGGYNAFWDLLFPNDKKQAKKMSIPATPTLLLPIFFIFALAGCPHPAPNPNGPSTTQQYDAAFAQCMQQKGITVAVNDGAAIWQILDNPNTTQTQKVQALEALGVTTATGALTDLASCALFAWVQINPVLQNKQPTPSQAATRVLLARHAPTVTMPKNVQ
jgi:ABC-type multidrug transport system fused ATPase/permease subunit